MRCSLRGSKIGTGDQGLGLAAANIDSVSAALRFCSPNPSPQSRSDIDAHPDRP
jgi:hypothetical protein